MQGTVLAWVEVLTNGRHWDETRDAPRIRQAFVTLAGSRRQWPAPADFLDALPKVEPLRALPNRPADPERASAAIRECAELLHIDRKTMAAGGDR